MLRERERVSGGWAGMGEGESSDILLSVQDHVLLRRYSAIRVRVDSGGPKSSLERVMKLL